MSLTSCLAKADGFIDSAIQADIQARAQTLEGRGQAGQSAARQAVQEAIDLLTRQLRVATNRAQEVRQSAPRDQLLREYYDAVDNMSGGVVRRDASYPRNVGQTSGVYARLKKASEARKLAAWLTVHDPVHVYSTEADNTQDAPGWTRVIQYRADGELLRHDNIDPASKDITQSAPRSTWYSGLQQAIEGVPERLATMAAPQWRLWLDANAAKLGVKKDEIEWSGVKDYLDTRGKDKVSKAEIAGYLAANGVKIEETVLGASHSTAELDAIAREQFGRDYASLDAGQRQEVMDITEPLTGETKYQDYTVAGGTNYREFLLTLPTTAPVFAAYDGDDKVGPGFPTAAEARAWAKENGRGKSIRQANESPEQYTSSHWDQKNVLAHLRVDDRVDADGNKVLMIQEIQSDWGADGRKKGFMPTPAQKAALVPGSPEAIMAMANGAAGNMRVTVDDGFGRDAGMTLSGPKPTGVPAGPFVTDTRAYVALALKRAIKLAVDEGYQKVAFVTGEQAADFFDLSKQLDSVLYDPSMGTVIGRKDGSNAVRKTVQNSSEIADVVGKDVAERLLAAPKNGYGMHELSGLDLKVGGEGMVKFYDDLVPNVTRDVLKKLGGGKMEMVEISADTDTAGTDPDYIWIMDSSDRGVQSFRTRERAETLLPSLQRMYPDKGLHIVESNPGTVRLKQPGFTITPAMKEKAAGGMAMFSAKRDPQTETAAFKAWFGDSKVVDANGAPMVVYHGTVADISTFKGSRIYFAVDADYANGYADSDSGGGNVLPVYLSLQNPLDLTGAGDAPISAKSLTQMLSAKGLLNGGLMGYITDKFKAPLPLWAYMQNPAIRAEIQVSGFDGIIQQESNGGPKTKAFIAFKPEQIKSATGNNGNFDAGSRDITQSTIRQKIDDAINQPKISIVGDNGRQYTPEQLTAMRQVGFQVETPSIKDRAKALTEGLGKRLAQGIFDQFAPIRDLDHHAYLLTRLSKGASGAFESFLHGGKLKLSDGVYDFDDQNRGGVIDKLLTPLGGEHHDFLKWIAANRAERLMTEGKENLFTTDDIDALKTLADGQLAFDYTLQHGPRAGQTTRVRADAYADSLKTFNDFSDNIMDMAEQSGLIDGDARQFWQAEFYVPFYRVSDEVDGGIGGMGSKGSMVRQEAFKKLKGGKNMLNADLLDNTLMNWAHLLDASAKNRAAKATLEAAVNLGVAVEANETTVKQMGKSAKTAPVWFQDGGKTRHFIVEDPMLLTAISSLEYAGMRNPVMNAMSTMKHILTVGVTASPYFKVRNLIRDSIQAIGTSPIGYNPASNIAKGWKLTDPKSDAYFRLLAGGGTIHFGSMLEGSEAKRIQKLVESGVDRSTILNDENAFKAFYRKVIEPTIDAYNELGNRGEGINRASLYDQLIKQGKSHAEASLEARSMMDFSMAGSFTSIRFLAQVLPFFSARLAGMYKLGQAAKEDPKRMAIVTGAVAMASVALLAAYGDDDDWKKRSDSDRHGFWWFKVGGIAYRIPKPFELGAIGTLAERGFEYMFDKEETGKRLRSQVLALLGDNLAMNPVPQAFKPILDIYANKDAFSGRPIESPGMEKLKSEYRFDDRTSMVARGASTALNAATGLIGKESLSPVQIDAMLRGYFGWLGSFVVGSADMIARPATSQPPQAKADIWKIATGNIMSDLRDAPSRYVNQIYEQAKELEQANGTYRMLVKTGKLEDAAEFKIGHADDLARFKNAEDVKQAAVKLNARSREIERSGMTADEKREALRRLQVQKEANAKRLAM